MVKGEKTLNPDEAKVPNTLNSYWSQWDLEAFLISKKIRIESIIISMGIVNEHVEAR